MMGDDGMAGSGRPGPALPVGVALAGGLAHRMGSGDKGLRDLAGMPPLRRALQALRACTDIVLISANGPAGRFAALDWLSGVPVVADGDPGNPGPLAGILAAMDWTAIHAPDRTQVLCVPCDAPFLPLDLYPALAGALAKDGGRIAMAAGPDGDGGWRRHPTVALWPVDLRDALRRALREEGMRKVGAFAARHGVTEVRFPPRPDGIDPFFNINSPEDLARAEALIRSAGP